MNPTKRILIALFPLLAAFTLPVFAQEEAGHLATLKNPEATLAEKQNACRELTQIGTAESIPVLAGLLSDEKLSHMARMALEPMPDPAVDEALRDALAKVKGRPVFGVIASIGVRGDTEAIPTLAGLLSNDDEAVTDAAARALGNIGTGDAAEALQTALDSGKVSPRQTKSLCEGLFRCAESLTEAGKAEDARKLYDAIGALENTPHQIRTAALRGAVLTRGEDGMPLLTEALRGDDYVMFASAIRIAMERGGEKTAEALASSLADLPAKRQIVAIDALGQIGNLVCGPALLKILDGADPAIKIAAVKTLTRLVHAPAVPVLAKLALAAGDDQLRDIARESLGGFPDKAADETILNLLRSEDADSRLLGAELIGQRDEAIALPALMKTASSETVDAERVAALKALRERAGMDEFQGLIAILLSTNSSSVIQSAAHALVAVCARQPAIGNIAIEKAIYGDVANNGKTADVTEKVADMVRDGATSIEASNGNFGDPAKGIPKQLTVHYSVDGVSARKTVAERESVKFTSPSAPPALVDPLVEALEKASGNAKVALLRVLETLGGTKALEAVHTAATDEDASVRKNAQRALCNWPSPDALAAVKDLALNSPDASLKSSALRGWLRLIPLQDASAEKKLEEVNQALALADKKQEKWAALGALREIPLAPALALVVPHLDDPELAEEACVAAVEISEKIAGKHPGEVNAAMTKVKGLTKDKRLAGRAGKLARSTRGK